MTLRISGVSICANVRSWRGKTDHGFPGRRYPEQRVTGLLLDGHLLQQRRDIVLEDEDVRIVRVSCAAGPGVAGAEIAGWIVAWKRLGGCGPDFALPGAGGSLWRVEDMLSGEGVIPAMRLSEHLVGSQSEPFAKTHFSALV
jgi:hypothetical protein